MSLLVEKTRKIRYNIYGYNFESEVICFMEFLLKLATKLCDSSELHKRPSISNIIYFLCGIIEIIIVISLLSPFHISCNFLDKIEMNTNVTNNDLFVRIAFWGLIVYIIVRVIRKILFYAFPQKDESELRYFHAAIYAIDDIIDALSALLSFLFVFAVFIQFYKSQIVFTSFFAWAIYIIVAIRFLAFIWARTFVKNLEVIDKALNKQISGTEN